MSRVSLYMYMDGPTYPARRDLVLTYFDDGLESGGGCGITPIAGQWFNVDCTFNTTVSANYVGIAFAPSASWTGTVYIDQVVATP